MSGGHCAATLIMAAFFFSIYLARYESLLCLHVKCESVILGCARFVKCDSVTLGCARFVKRDSVV